MAPVVTVTRESLERRRAALLDALGMTLDDFRTMAATRSLTAEEDEAREELDEIAFLLGESFTGS